MRHAAAVALLLLAFGPTFVEAGRGAEVVLGVWQVVATAEGPMPESEPPFCLHFTVDGIMEMLIGDMQLRLLTFKVVNGSLLITVKEGVNTVLPPRTLEIPFELNEDTLVIDFPTPLGRGKERVFLQKRPDAGACQPPPQRSIRD